MNEENVEKSRCHKCGCVATEDNWISTSFVGDKKTCERCHGIKPKDTANFGNRNMAIADALLGIQILEPNVSKGIAYVRIGSQKPMYCMLNTSGVYFTPTIQELNNSQLRDILDHKVHMSRTHLIENATCSYDWEDQENNRLLTFDVYAYISPYVPAKLYGPPENCYPEEGGQIEDFYVILNNAEFYDANGDTVKTKSNLTWRQVMDLELAFETELNKHSSCFNSVQELLFESGSLDDREYDD